LGKTIKNFTSDKNKSLFGICVGMQILSTYGYEYGKSDGLNIIKEMWSIWINKVVI
jgi:imidazoleglycerol phosphate synthase glutamine amidotransferase subunit HisH